MVCAPQQWRESAGLQQERWSTHTFAERLRERQSTLYGAFCLRRFRTRRQRDKDANVAGRLTYHICMIQDFLPPSSCRCLQLSCSYVLWALHMYRVHATYISSTVSTDATAVIEKSAPVHV